METATILIFLLAGGAAIPACIISLQEVASGEGTVIGSGGYAVICLGVFAFSMYQVISGMPALLDGLI